MNDVISHNEKQEDVETRKMKDSTVEQFFESQHTTQIYLLQSLKLWPDICHFPTISG